MHRSTRARIAAISAVCAAVLTGCSVVASIPSETAAETVTILTHDSFALSDELIAKFEHDSGYDLVITSPGDAGVVASQLLLAGDTPGVDGVYGIDNFSAPQVVDAGVLADYTSPALPASAAELTPNAALTPIDQGQVCINIDHAWFADHGVAEPTTLDDLAEPQYATLLAVTSPATSSPGLAFLAATVANYGEHGWQQYWQQLLAGGTKVDASWSDAYYVDFSGADGHGNYPLVLSYSSSPAETGGATGVLEASCVTQIEYAAVTAGAANPAGAKAFLDFLLSDEVQQSLPESMYVYPVNSEIALPEAWATHASLVANPITPDPAAVAANSAEWIRQWTALNEGR